MEDVAPPTEIFPWESCCTSEERPKAERGLVETALEFSASCVICRYSRLPAIVPFSVLMAGPESAPTSMVCVAEANFRAMSKRRVWRAANWAEDILKSAKPG